jgi:hypothetical protein
MKVLLGGGLSARVFAFYNPEYLWVAPQGGGQVDVKSFEHSIILPAGKICEDFLQDIALVDGKSQHFEPIRIQIGYVMSGSYIEGEPPESIKQELLKKKLSGFIKPPSLFSEENVLAEAYIKDDDRGAMWTYGIKTNDLLGYLAANSRPVAINAKAVSISDHEITLDDGMVLSYSHLVSTIPANIFWKIYKGPYSEQKTFVGSSFFTTDMRKESWLSYGYPELPDNSMCYFPEAKYGFDRVRTSALLQGDDLALEGPSSFHDAVEIPFARILRCYDNIAPPAVMFLGRYAEWNPDLVISDVIRRSSRKFFLNSIFAHQKAFNKRFVSYAPDLGTVQHVVKDYMLHLFSECDSLLNTINWKLGSKNEINLDRDKVLEEWIDVYKFWLSIGLVFGFDVREFEDVYWKKSKKVEERYKDK